MTDDEIKNLIETEVTKGQNKTLLIIGSILFTIVGIALPLYITSSSSSRVDDAVKEMKNDVRYLDNSMQQRLEKIESRMTEAINNSKNDVKDLTREQKSSLSEINAKVDSKLTEFENKFNVITKEAYRKPKLICLLNDKQIPDTFYIDKSKIRHAVYLTIKNDSDATAKNVQVFLYVEANRNVSIYENFYMSYEQPLSNNNYIGYAYQNNNFSLDPGQNKTIDFFINPLPSNVDKTSAKFILQLFYGQPKRTEYHFTVKIE